MNLDVKVTVKGGIFKGDIPRIVERQVRQEILNHIEARTSRKNQGKGIGARRNTISHSRERMELGIASTRIWPRTTGKAWQRKNIRIIKSMAPRVGKKAMERIAEELGGA